MKKQVLELKNQKQFRLADVILYAVIVAFVVGLFFAFSKKTDLDFVGVDAQFDSKVIMTYRFDSDALNVDGDWQDKVTVARDGEIIRVKFNFGDEYNVLEIDRAKKCAKMIAADCSHHKECFNEFPAIDSADKFTICVPHKLQIRGVGESKGEVSVG